MAASICTQCPPASEIKRLLDGDLTDVDQSRLTAHLDCCEGCQRKIEELATGGQPLLAAACASDQARPDQTSAYWGALRAVERDVAKVAHSAMAVTRAADQATADDEARVDLPLVIDNDALTFLDPPQEPGTIGKLGRFHVVELIGRGGMGLVLRALDVCLQRHVALKVLDPQYAKNDLARNRFIREARAAASITHENVVAVHHVEKHRDELPFLVMRLVTGESLQERLDRQGGPLAIGEILEIGQQMAAGLAAAHAQTLIHRDIKPANILLEKGTGKVLLTDFGLARAAEDAKLTQTGFVAGTPLYMSPEQARGEKLDERSDLFSLGSVLYAMATGTPPFQGSSPFVVLREVTEGRHRPAHEANPDIPEDLAVIIEHLLAKKPEDRVQTAREVADLLRQQLLKHATRPEAAASSRRSLRSLARSRSTWWNRHAGGIAIAIVACNLALLTSELTGLTRWTVLSRRGIAAPSAALEQTPARLVLDAGTGPIWSVAYSPDGKTLAMGIDDGSVRLWDAQSGQLMSRIPAHTGPIWNLAFSNDGATIATASDDGFVRLWDPRTSMNLDEINLHTPVRAVAFSPDGERLAVGTRGGLVRVLERSDLAKVVHTAGHVGVVMSLAFSADGKLLASASGDRTVKVWNVSQPEGREVTTLQGHQGGVYSVAFHPKKPIVASGSWDRTIRLWDVNTGKEIRKLEGHAEDIWSVAFCSEGVVLASGSEDRSVKLWEVETGRELKTLRGNVGTIYSVAISPIAKTIATGGRDGMAYLFDVPAH
jgi:serine/threonine protein kinase